MHDAAPMIEHFDVRGRLESFLFVLAVGALVAIGAKRVNLPYNVALVVVGLVLVFADVLPHTPMDPEIILVAFLPVLVFEGALGTDATALRRASKPILALAIPGVAISLVGTAAVATLVLGLPFPAALLLGALLAITDTVSVLLAFRSVRVPHRLAAIMEGESLFNDGTALVLVSLATGVVATGAIDVSDTVRALALAMFGGALLGAAFGALGAALLRRVPDHLTAILASIVLVFATSLIAERVHASPVIAVVVAGLIVGRAARTALEPSRILALFGFWETMGFGLNVLLFLLVGIQLDAAMLIEEAPSIALAVLALHVGRAVAVYGCFTVMRLVGSERVPIKWQHVMVAGNIKGALSMAAVLALPSNLPHRERLVAIVFGATFATLLLQGLPFRKFITWVGAVLPPPEARLERARATLIAARRGQRELDTLLAAGLVARNEHAARQAAFQKQVIEAERVLANGTSDGGAALDGSLLLAQKAAVLDASRRGLVGESVAAETLNALDRQLMDLERREGH